MNQIDTPLFIEVYLEGEFDAGFKRLQVETAQYLEQLRSLNNKIKINFKNPNNQREALIKKGMLPSQLTVMEDGKMSEAIIFPWAEIRFGKKTTIVSLLPSSIVASQEEQLEKDKGVKLAPGKQDEEEEQRAAEEAPVYPPLGRNILSPDFAARSHAMLAALRAERQQQSLVCS